MNRLVIVDYGLGNLRSVYRGLEKSGARPVITFDTEEIAAADAIVLPGVGAFRDGMDQIGEMQQVLTEAAASVPMLGICLGMQMLLEWSEEHGLHAGLGIIPGTVRRFDRSPGYKIPHMGWNSLESFMAGHPLMEGIREGAYVYFVHSYYADTRAENTLTSTPYIRPFASAITSGNVHGVQFHPEKSGVTGLRILENFIGLI
ncbi:MAG: imidazole glycerol phosphate synthase subunit HisH [Methanoregulaceae archaeon]|jgi:glutamine amidotransferase|nr:imidazole glycerol phosphate synthase subunit HisH [Methanoregulaceae archaeon]